MKVAVIFNKDEIKDSDVINRFGMPSKERYRYSTIEMVTSALENGGHNVRIIEGNMHVIAELENFMPKVVRGERPGMIFNMAYGIQGQSRYTHIPAMLEMLGVPYVGSGPAAHAIALDKVMSKIVFLQHRLPTPTFWMFSSPDENLKEVNYPVIVKPKMEAVSFGLRVVDNETDLREAIAGITEEFQQAALVEEFIPGREFAVAMLGNGASLETLPIVEIDLGGDPKAIQTLDNKMNNPRRKLCPANISEEVAERLRKLAMSSFNALGLFDFARVDFRMDAEGGLHILEINSMASLNPTGSFVHAAEVAGMDFTDLVNRMLDTAALRYFGKSYLVENGYLEEKENKKPEPFHIRVRSYLRSHLPTTLDYLQKMVSISSHVSDIEGVNELGNWISNRFQHLGFHRQVYPQTEVGNVYYFSNHLEEQNDILLLTHLDTRHDHRNFVPFTGEHGRVFGSGVTESKGGIAVILAALQAMRFARMLKMVRIGILFTPDDNLNSRYSKEIVARCIRSSKHVIGAKYGDINGGIVISCSGTQQYQVDLKCLRTGKNCSNPDVIANISKKNIAWEKLSETQEGIEVIIDTLKADRSQAAVQFTTHYIKRHQLTQLDQEIRKIADKGNSKDIQMRIRVIGSRPPVADNPENRSFFERVQKLAQLLEVKAEPIHRQISSDICQASEGIPSLGGLGPLGAESGTPDEYILRDSLIDRSALLALIIQNCGKE